MRPAELNGTPGAQLLLIDDEPRVRRLLRVSLSAHRYRLLEATTAEEGLNLAAQYAPDLLLVDLGLPDLDGAEVVRRVREWSSVPIIVVSARTREAQKVAALDAGADDYLTKPFGMEELLARIRASLRRATRARDVREPVFTSGPLAVDLVHRRVTLSGAEVQLTAIEYKLLAALVEHAGKVLTHRQLLEAVWGPQRSEQTQYVRVYMAHLRRKLEPDPARPRLFLTETGVGYRLRPGEAELSSRRR